MSVLGTKGTFIIYKDAHWAWHFPFYKVIELNCEGQGIRGDPFIITPSKKIPNTFYVRGCRSHVRFKNIHTDYIAFNDSSYVILENC